MRFFLIFCQVALVALKIPCTVRHVVYRAIMKTERKPEPVGICGKFKIAAFLGLSVPTITRLIKEDESLAKILKQLPGGRLIAHKADLEAWLRGKERP